MFQLWCTREVRRVRRLWERDWYLLSTDIVPIHVQTHFFIKYVAIKGSSFGGILQDISFTTSEKSNFGTVFPVLPKYHLFNKPRCQASDVYIFSLVEMWSAIVDRHKYKQQFYFNLTANSDNLSFSKSFYIVVKLLFWRQEIPSIRRFSLIARCFISLCNKREHDSSNLHEVFVLSVMTSCIYCHPCLYRSFHFVLSLKRYIKWFSLTQQGPWIISQQMLDENRDSRNSYAFAHEYV